MNLEEACKILGTSKGDYKKEKLKVYYREKAKVCHPDTGGSEESFKLLQEAYEFLLAYKPSTQYTKNKRNNTTESNKTSFNAFGQKRKKRRKKPLDPQDVVINIEVSVKELHEGFEQVVKYTRRKACDNCHGSGCYICDGQIQHQDLEVAVYIHSSLMNDEFEIIYAGLGEITYEEADLVLKLKIVGSKLSLEYKDKIKYPVVTSTATIAEGQTKLYVDTLDGKVKITIPPDHKGTLNLKGKGLLFGTHKGNVRGDHYVTLNYITK
jgi:DnaJ-class molecular chaperone